MKAAVVNKDHSVGIIDKPVRALEHGEALLTMECCWCMPYRLTCEKR